MCFLQHRVNRWAKAAYVNFPKKKICKNIVENSPEWSNKIGITLTSKMIYRLSYKFWFFSPWSSENRFLLLPALDEQFGRKARLDRMRVEKPKFIWQSIYHFARESNADFMRPLWTVCDNIFTNFFFFENLHMRFLLIYSLCVEENTYRSPINRRVNK